jgi:hypothetical protein
MQFDRRRFQRPLNEDARPAVTTADEVTSEARRGPLAPPLGLAPSSLAPAANGAAVTGKVTQAATSPPSNTLGENGLSSPRAGAVSLPLADKREFKESKNWKMKAIKVHAMEVLKANALDFARRIDELRCVLVESAPQDDKKLNRR